MNLFFLNVDIDVVCGVWFPPFWINHEIDFLRVGQMFLQTFYDSFQNDNQKCIFMFNVNYSEFQMDNKLQNSEAAYIMKHPVNNIF